LRFSWSVKYDYRECGTAFMFSDFSVVWGKVQQNALWFSI